MTHRPPTTSCSVNSHRPPIDTWGKIRIRPDGPYLRLPDFFREHTPAPDIYLGGQYGPSPTPRFRILSVAVSEWTPDMTNARPAHGVCGFTSILVYIGERGYPQPHPCLPNTHRPPTYTWGDNTDPPRRPFSNPLTSPTPGRTIADQVGPY